MGNAPPRTLNTNPKTECYSHRIWWKKCARSSHGVVKIWFNGDPAWLQVLLMFTKTGTNTNKTRRANTESRPLMYSPVTFCYCSKVKEKGLLLFHSAHVCSRRPFPLSRSFMGLIQIFMYNIYNVGLHHDAGRHEMDTNQIFWLGTVIYLVKLVSQM